MMTAKGQGMHDEDDTISARDALLASARDITLRLSEIDHADPDHQIVVEALGSIATALRASGEALTRSQ